MGWNEALKAAGDELKARNGKPKPPPLCESCVEGSSTIRHGLVMCQRLGERARSIPVTLDDCGYYEKDRKKAKKP